MYVVVLCAIAKDNHMHIGLGRAWGNATRQYDCLMGSSLTGELGLHKRTRQVVAVEGILQTTLFTKIWSSFIIGDVAVADVDFTPVYPRRNGS